MAHLLTNANQKQSIPCGFSRRSVTARGKTGEAQANRPVGVETPTGRSAPGEEQARPTSRICLQFDYEPPNWVLTEVKVAAAFVPIA